MPRTTPIMPTKHLPATAISLRAAVMVALVLILASPGLIANAHANAKYRTSASAAEPIGRFESNLGYTLDLSGTDWTHWETVDDSVWHPDVAGENNVRSAFVSIPACYTGWTPKPHAVRSALFRAIGLSYPNADYKELKKVEIDGREGKVWSHSRENQGVKFHYRLYSFKNGACTQLLAVWTSLDTNVLEQKSAELLNGLSFNNLPTEHPDPAMAWFYNSAGLYYHQVENYTEALEGFERAALIEPGDQDYVNNTASIYNRLGRYEAGLAFVLRPPMKALEASAAGSAMLHGWVGWFQYHLQDFASAADSYQKAFAQGALGNEDLIAYIRSLIQAERYSKAKAVINEHQAAQPTVEMVRVKTLLASAQNDHTKALDILNEALTHFPLNAELAFERMDVLANLQRYDEIVDASNQLINAGSASALAYHYRGDAQYKQERYLDAKQSFEAALMLAPGDATVMEYLRFTDAQLGKGDSSSIQSRLDPITLPSLKAPDRVTDIEEYDSYYKMYAVAYRFNPDKPLKTTTTQHIKVLDQAGVRRYSTLTAEFNPLSEKLYVNQLQVFDENDELVSDFDRSSLYIGNSQDYDQATFGKVVRAPVAGLAPGYSIEFVYTKERLSADREFQFERLYLSGSRPIGLSAIYIEGKLNSLLHNEFNTEAPRKKKNTLLWVAHNPPVSQNEPMQVDPAEYLASVALTSQAQWRTAGADYREHVDELIGAEAPELKTLVQKLTAGIPPSDEAARVAALAGYVQSTLTYKALEFGVRGYTPNTPSQTLSDRFGDCKDHSVLLWRLLGEAGIQAELALANFSGPVDPELPSIDQFDHMVVYLPSFRNGTFIDATNKDINLIDYTPSALGNSWTLTLGDKPMLVKIPEHSPSHISVKRDLALQPDGDLLITETISLSAYFASSLRAHFKSIERREQLNWIQRFLGDGGERVVVKSLDVTNLFDPAQELILTLRYQVNPLSHTAESKAILDPAYWERYYLSSNLVHNRQTDFEIAYPLVFEADISYSAPHLKSGSWQPGLKQHKQTRFGQYSSTHSVEPKKSGVHFRYETTAGRFDASDYSQYQQFSAEALDVLQQPITWTENERL